jgi:2'-5' RNA ligase
MFVGPDLGDRINSFSLVSYIPDPLAAFLNLLRQELVPNCFLRAHVTILPPRPNSATIDHAWGRLLTLAEQFEPFTVELAGVDVFPHSDVIHIALSSGHDQLRRMHDAMNVDGLFFKEAYPYHPHITLAQNLKPDELDELIRVAHQRWKDFPRPRSFRVETLTFVQATRWKEWIDLREHHLATEPLSITKVS